MKTPGQALRLARIAAGMTLDAASAAVGCSSGFFSNLESGRFTRVQPKLATCIEREFGVSCLDWDRPINLHPNQKKATPAKHDVEGICKAYLSGVESPEIRLKYGVSQSHLNSLLKRNGIPSRGNYRRHNYASDRYVQAAKERFLSFVSPEPNSGCWLWMGVVSWEKKEFRARFSFRGRGMIAARVAFELFKAQHPGELFVCHSCDNPACVNPDHLWLGTASDNIRDCVSKGRHGKQKRLNGSPKDRTQGNKAAPATGHGLVTAHTGQVCVPVAGLVGGNHGT